MNWGSFFSELIWFSPLKMHEKYLMFSIMYHLCIYILILLYFYKVLRRVLYKRGSIILIFF